jgi:hypothetical protein
MKGSEQAKLPRDYMMFCKTNQEETTLIQSQTFFSVIDAQPK